MVLALNGFKCDRRANTMVDVLSTRLQEVYAKWESRTEVKRNLEPSSNLYSMGGKVSVLVVSES